MGRPLGSKNAPKSEPPKAQPLTNRDLVRTQGTPKADKSVQPLKNSDDRRVRIMELITPKKTNVVDVEWDVKDAEFKAEGWIIVLTYEGHLYQEPVPRYANFQTFIRLICNMPDGRSAVGLKDSEIERLQLGTPTFPFELLTQETPNGCQSPNELIRCFRPGPKPCHGNLIFAKSLEEPLSSKDCEKALKWIIKQLQKDEEVDLKD